MLPETNMFTITHPIFPIIFCIASFAYAEPATVEISRQKPGSSTVIEQTVPEKTMEISVPMENSGFETGMSNSQLPGWRMSQHTGSKAYAMTIDAENAVEGKQSFRMERTSEQIYGLIEQLVTLPEGAGGKPTTYSAMLKTRDVGDEGWRLIVTFHGATGAILDQKRSPPMTGTHDWSRVTVDAVIPEGTRTAAVGAILLDKGTGWIDDNRLSLATPAVSNDSVTVVEYYHAGLDRYFMTAFPEEIKVLDSARPPGWARTGESFLASAAQGNGLAGVCRFFSLPFGPKNAHFYTPDTAECAATKSKPEWAFEATAFHVRLPSADGGCVSGGNRLYHLYKQDVGGAPTHRYTTNRAIRARMIGRGWLPEGRGDEGVIACTL